MPDYAIVLKNVSKSYALYTNQLVDRLKETFLPSKNKYHTLFEAVKPLNLKIKKGETVGIIGHNGAGKSTLLKLIAGVKKPTHGSVHVDGRIVALLELGAGFNPEFSGLENIYFHCSLLGMSRAETEQLTPEILEFAEIGEHIYQPVKLYSSGMRARLAFSVSIAIDPDILILDEVLSVGDVLFQRKCFAKMEEFFHSGKTILFVSHNVDSVRSLCQRALLFHKGALILDGPSHIVTPRYHKLMFTPAAQQQKIIEKINEIDKDHTLKQKLADDPAFDGLSQNLQNTSPSNIPENQLADFHAEDFEPKSRKIVKTKNITIRDYYLERREGGRVTHLNHGNRYRLIFYIDFNESLRFVNFVAWFYSAKTKLITGITLPGENSSIDEIIKGNQFRVSADFTCHFNRGLYGIRLLVKGENDHTIVPVSTIHDALLFQVLDDKDEVNQGFIKILDTWELDKL